MGKRGNESAQVSREQYEAMMERAGSDEVGTFERVDAAQARRKVVKIRRSSSNAPEGADAPEKPNPFGFLAGQAAAPAPAPASASFASMMGAAKPPPPTFSAGAKSGAAITFGAGGAPAVKFGGPSGGGAAFGGKAAAAKEEEEEEQDEEEEEEQSAQPAKRSKPSFGAAFGGSGAGGGAAAKPMVFGTPAKVAAPAKATPAQAAPNKPAFSPAGSSPAVKFGAASSSAERPRSYYSHMASLNRSFARWVAEQQEQNPMSVWTEGIQDYVRFAAKIDGKFPAGSAPASAAQTPAPAPAPAPTPAKTPASFAFGKGATTAADTPVQARLAFETSPPSSPAKKAGGPPAGFTFGAKPTPAPAPAPAPSPSPAPASAGFKFGGQAPAPASAGFKFGADAPAADKKPTFGGPGFKFGAAAPAAAPAPAAAAAAAEEDDDGKMPEEEEPTVLRVADGDEEDIKHEVKAKLFRLKPKTDEDEGGWAEMGVGQLRVLVHKSKGAARCVMRNTSGRVTLNVPLFAGMTITKKDAKTVSFMGPGPDGKPTTFLVRTRPENLETLKREMEAQVPSS